MASTSNYWPVVWWMASTVKEGDDEYYVYVPSHAHLRVHRSRPCKTWEAAMKRAIKHIPDRTDLEMRAKVSMFKAYVVKQDKRPDVSIGSSIKLIVRRIPLGVTDE